MSRTPSELNFQPDTNLLLRAGAGAGKTTTLIRLFFETVDHFRSTHKRWPRIVLTTFTRKATQEIRERLMKEALRREDPELFKLLQSRYYVQISTIHGVLSLFLSRSADKLGLPKDFQLVDEYSLLKHEKSVLKKELEKNPTSLELLEEYSFKELLTIVKALAEARSMGPIRRYSQLDLEQDLQKEIDWVIAQGRSLRVQGQNEPLTEKWQEYLKHFNFLETLAPQIQDRIEQFRSFLENKPSKPRFVSGKSPISDSFNEKTQEILDGIKTLVEKKLDFVKHTDRYERLTLSIESLATSYRASWLKFQTSVGRLTMQDLETLSAEILRRNPEVGVEFSEAWDFWMVDEYQDTSPRQDFLLTHLRGAKSEFVVGDPQQSIYLFRGSRSEVFENKQISMKGLVTSQLVNYRSRKEVLEFINDYFSKISNKFEPMIVGSSATRPEDPACVILPGPGEVTEQDLSDSVSSSDWCGLAVISRIQELIARGAKPEEICVLSRSHKNLKTLASLAKAAQVPYYHHSSGQFYQRREIKDALQILRFLDNPHDNVNLVGLLRSPWFFMPDEEIQKICTGQSYWLKAQASLLTNSIYSTGSSLSTGSIHSTDSPLVTDLNFSADSVYKDLATMLADSQHLGDLAVFKKTIIEKGLIHSCYGIDPTGQREANLWKLIQLCENLQAQGTFQGAEFLDRAQRGEADAGIEEVETTAVIEPSRVQMMTIHAAKGLQFPHVIITGFGDSSPPRAIELFNYDEEEAVWAVTMRDLESGSRLVTPRAHKIQEIQKHREQEESLRLLYVALTRAQDSITLVWDQKKKNSWAAFCPFDLSVEGPQIHGNYLVEIRRGIEHQAPSILELNKTTEVINPWRVENLSPSYQISVTELTQLSKKPQGLSNSSKEGYRLSDFEKSKKGQKAHRIFESLKFQRDLDFIANEDPSLKAGVEFIVNLKNPPIVEFFESQTLGEAQVEVEWGFTVDWFGKKLTGQIDLWAFYQDQLWVIDYKTGSPESAKKAQSQLEIYAECLFKTKRAPETCEVLLAAIYPLDEKVFITKYKNRADLQGSLGSIALNTHR
ncbi:MAG: UvrD-helicase domain-containing protein [Bdellovibrionaceae bacterium]|nr:UvrD-helicase domain-containing protein [Pseudobdellovibrionaceae bacterium]